MSVTPRWLLTLPIQGDLIDPGAPASGPIAISGNFTLIDSAVGANISAGAPTAQVDGELNYRTDTNQLSYHAGDIATDRYFPTHVSGQLDLDFDYSVTAWNILTTSIPSGGAETVMADMTFLSHGSMFLRGKLTCRPPAFNAVSPAQPKIIWRVRYGAGAITTGSSLLYQGSCSYETSAVDSGSVDFQVPMPASTFTVGSTFHIGVTAQAAGGGSGITYTGNGTFDGTNSYMRGYIQ